VTVLADCPKDMTYGPCGGVRVDGACEVDGFDCPFVDDATVPWSGGAPETAPWHELLDVMARRTAVVVDLPATGTDVGVASATAAELARIGGADAALLGDAPWARVQLPPTLWSSIVRAVGLRPWPVLQCRDRNRVALESELAGLVAGGVAGVHCVTGDHPATGHRPDAAPVYDLDSTELASLARRYGALVSVGETLAAPPTDRRAARLAEKVRAGAQVCFVHHGDDTAALARFVCDAQATGATVPLLVAIPLVVDPSVLPWLARISGVPDALARVLETAGDPWAAGVREATRVARAALAVPGIAGVDLSIVARPGGELDAVRAAAAVSDEIRGG
jgi:5,10-methylenetetrahydrofolate reductase